MNFLMIDGAGNPNTAQRYKDALASLYPLAYAIKFAVREQAGVEFSVMPLEGLWWGTSPGQTVFRDSDKDRWLWTLMIGQPEMVTAALVETMRQEVRRKKNPPLLDQIRFASFAEGLVVQIMHIGPYCAEAASVECIHRYAADQDYVLRGKHHEIYLSNPERTAPERLKTILRHPIAPAASTESSKSRLKRGNRP